MQLSHSHQGIRLQALRPRQACVLLPRRFTTTARAAVIENMDEEDKFELQALPDLKVKWWAEVIAAVGSAVQRMLMPPPIIGGVLKPRFFDWDDWARTCPNSEGYVVVRNDTGSTIEVFVHKVMPMRQVIKLGAQAAVNVTGGGVKVPIGLALVFAQQIDKLQYTPSVAAGEKVYAYVGYFSGGAYITARPPGSKTHVYCVNDRVPAGKRADITGGVGEDPFRTFEDPVQI